MAATAGRLEADCECHGLALTNAALCELDAGRPVVEIPWVEVRGLALCRGVAAERPLVAFVLGAGLVVLGSLFARDLLLWLMVGGTAYDVEAFAVGLIPIGLWVVHVSMRRRYYVRVRTRSGERKLAFGALAEREDVLAFAEVIERTAGRNVHITLGDGGRTGR